MSITQTEAVDKLREADAFAKRMEEQVRVAEDRVRILTLQRDRADARADEAVSTLRAALHESTEWAAKLAVAEREVGPLKEELERAREAAAARSLERDKAER